MLLERDEESRALDAALASVRAGEGRLVVIEGHAGLGKSALLAAARERARGKGIDVLSARGAELERDFAFGVCLQLFEPRLAREGSLGRKELLAGSAGLARPLLEGEAGALAVQHDGVLALVHGLFWLCSNLASRNPLLLAVDDAHWADRASLRFLLYLSERLRGLPVALMVTTRLGDPDAPRDMLTRLRAVPDVEVERLAALSESGTRTLVRERWPDAAEAFARVCAEMSGGNPFYLHELIRALETEGLDPNASSVERVGRFAPDSVLRSVLARLERFPPSGLVLARSVAVLGGSARLRHAAALARIEVEEAARLADSLAAAEILQTGERLSYVHPLLQSTVYADISAAERGLWHARAARVMAEEIRDALAAAHLLLAPAMGERWVVELLREAARQALATGGAESAVRYLARALKEPPPVELRALVLVELAQAEATTGVHVAEAVDHLQQAVVLMADSRERGETILQLGWTLQKAGRPAEAAAAFARGLEELGNGGDDDLATRLEVAYLGAAWVDETRAGEIHDRRAALLANRRLIGKEARRGLLAQQVQFELAAAASHERLIQLAVELLDGGALIRDESSDSLNVWVAVGGLTWADALDVAEEAVEWALEDARRRGAFLNAAMGYCLRAWPRYWRGAVADAAADAQIAIDAGSGGGSMVVPVARVWLGLANIELEQFDAAEAALDLADDDPSLGTLMHGGILTARGRLALARAQPEVALTELERAAGIIRDTFAFDNPAALSWRADAAIAAAGLGEITRARALIDEEIGVARRFGAGRAIGAALRAAGLVWGGTRGIASLEEAVAVLEKSPSKLELARALIDLGGAMRRAGSRAEAREPLRRGLAMAERFGAFRLERQARDELAATGARLGQRTISGRASLTPSERRVAEMAAAGMSNRTIAQSLFVTVNAVKWHLRHAYGKLGISSRDQLGDALGDSLGGEKATSG